MKLLQIQNSIFLSLIAAFTMGMIFLFMFEVMEPSVTDAATSAYQGVIVNETITGEISFKTGTTTVTMQPSGGINGLTGGVSSGTTTAIVTTNNSAGYTMTVRFSSTTAMARNGGSGYINNYAPAVSNTPDYTFGTAKPYGQFGYTVYSTSTGADIVSKFLSNGSACGSGSSVAGHCWINPSTTALTVVNRTTATPPSGATTSIAYHVVIPSGPSPAIPTGVYTATTTLTATTN